MTSFVYVLTYVSTHLLKTYLPTNLCTQATHALLLRVLPAYFIFKSTGDIVNSG